MFGSVLNFLKTYRFQIASSFMMFFCASIFLLSIAVSIRRQNLSSHYTDVFIEQYCELPLSYFALNRRGGVVWSSVAHSAFDAWLNVADVDSAFVLSLNDRRARQEFNFGMLHQVLP